MAFKAPNPSSTKRITCPYDKGENKTTFTISEALPYAVRITIKDKFSEFIYTPNEGQSQAITSIKYNYAKRNAEIVKHGLVSVENFFDANGKPADVKRVENVLTDESLQSLSIPLGIGGFDTLIDWLATEIWNANNLKEEELKN